MPNPDAIFELRFYRVQVGRDADMRARVQKDLNRVFPKHGIRPLGSWTAVSAPSLPMFVYITPFENMLERARCWASFYADPDWHEVRARTNAGSELVEEYEIQFLRGLTDWTEDAPGGLDEIVIQRTLIGKGAAAAEALAAEREALEHTGAFVQGQFEMLSGGILPAAVTFLRWRDWNTRANAQQTLDFSSTRSKRMARELAAYGQPLLGHRTSFLLSPVPVAWA